MSILRIAEEELAADYFCRAAEWAKAGGCSQLKVETQNINVAACKFYASRGCHLGAINRYGYVNCEEAKHEVMLLWYVEL